jgi:aminopeptidase N
MSTSSETLERARTLGALDDFDASMRRRVVDLADELDRRIAIRKAFPAS